MVRSCGPSASGLETALAYEALFGIPVRELFRGFVWKDPATLLRLGLVGAGMRTLVSAESAVAHRFGENGPPPEVCPAAFPPTMGSTLML